MKLTFGYAASKVWNEINKTLELSFILFEWGLGVKILLLLSGEGGWEFLVWFVTTRPNEKQRKPCK
jgi:hypothetical protein